MSQSILSVERLHFRYPDYPGLASPPLFEGLNLELGQREVGILLGAPDSGKTTLSWILSGLAPRFTGGTLSGALVVNGSALAERRPYELLKEVGLVFQNSEAQILTTRCDTEVAFGLESLGVPPREMRGRVREALEWMEIGGYARKNPGLLSGGEKKRLLLACLLALDPAIWILDETFEELDEQARGRLLQLLGERRRAALILSSKWLDRFQGLGERYFLLSDRRARGWTVEAHRADHAAPPPDLLAGLRREGLVLEGEGETGKTAAFPAPSGARQAPGEPVLQARGLRFRYPGEAGFSLHIEELEVHRGEILALVGRNGSGKSTLARLLCGLLDPQAGEIRIRRGDRWRSARGEELKAFAGYMFQNPDFQIFLPTVREELAYGLERMGLGEEPIRRRVADAAERFRLPPLFTPPALMSYGARKRLQAAVYSLLARPLLILDEGDSGLSFRDFIAMVHTLSSAAGAAQLLITHNRDLARRLGHRIAELDRGRIVAVEEGRR